ncbi:MAG TPA: VOC family protein [Candidatus Acidoferrales bacterium]|jgi:PhnB protein|nr:VOC family protein [Candidatus Acidoferrales bacterium]
MKLLTYVNYNGKCAEAFRFYEKHLGGKIVMMMTHGESPAPNPNVPADWKSAILHARIDIGGTSLLGADIPNAEPMKSTYLSLMIKSVDEAERIYAVLLEGGQVFMPMEETFFAVRFAMLRDKFGASWMLLKERPQA